MYGLRGDQGRGVDVAAARCAAEVRPAARRSAGRATWPPAAPAPGGRRSPRRSSGPRSPSASSGSPPMARSGRIASGCRTGRWTAGGTVDVAGLRIRVCDTGAAESHADSYLVVEAGERRLAFIGDLAFDGVHSYTADGHSGAWLSTLDRLAGELAGMPLYPPSPPSSRPDRRRGVRDLRAAVSELAGRSGTARSASPHWRNEVTRGSLHDGPRVAIPGSANDRVPGSEDFTSSNPARDLLWWRPVPRKERGRHGESEPVGSGAPMVFLPCSGRRGPGPGP
jgi:hypothetical protein